MSARDEYTPSDVEVQVDYAVGRYGENRREGQLEFRRWLAAHDAEVRAKAVEETTERIEAMAFGIAESQACGSCAGEHPCTQCMSDARAALAALQSLVLNNKGENNE
jgi:hypothetical protein